MKCFRCGNPLPSTSRFCAHCGVRVSDPNEETLQVAPQAAGDDLVTRMRLLFDGEYDIEEEIARGGMGIVLRGKERALGRPVALKVLPPELGPSTRAIERFRREALTIADLDHRNIVPVYRMGQTGGVFFIAMKLVHGRALDRILTSQGPFTIPLAIHVLRQAAAGLAYAHQQKVVHRDIKSANLLVGSDGRVMVSDFGVALRTSDVTLTADGAVIGTPPFMSPEQCSGFRASPQSDQYALGIVAFEMLTGAVPFASETVAGYIQHHLHTALPDLREARGDVPDDLRAVIERMLAKKPEERFDTTDELLATIERLPFSPSDRAESSDLLRRLARGEDAAEHHVRTTPIRIISSAPTQPIATASRRSVRSLPRALVLAGAGAMVVGVTWAWPLPPSDPPPGSPPARATISAARGAPPSSPVPPPPAPTGLIRLLVLPANALIDIDGRRVGTGSAFDVAVAAGLRHVHVRAPGYAAWDSTVTIVKGATTLIGRVRLRAGSSRP